jgi:hypothetical protein
MVAKDGLKFLRGWRATLVGAFTRLPYTLLFPSYRDCRDDASDQNDRNKTLGYRAYDRRLLV